MRDTRTGRQSGMGDLVVAIALLAIGRRDGYAHMPATVRGFLASLAPLVAFALVGAVLAGAAGHGALAIVDLLSAVVALLAPAVISEPIARAFGRDAQWLRYATGFNWCQWAIPFAAIIALLVLGRGLSPRLLGTAVMAFCVYALWLHWFLARAGLGIGGWRAVLVVLAVNGGTAVLVIGPHALAVAGR